MTAESPSGGTDRGQNPPSAPQGVGTGPTPPSQPKVSLCPQVCHCLGFFCHGIQLLGKIQTGGRSPEQPLRPFWFCPPNRDWPQVWGGWRVGVLPVGCRAPGLSVPALQGGSASEQTSERENLSCGRRFLGSAFGSFCSACLDALLPALINVCGGKLPPVLHPPVKKGERQSRTSALIF